MQKAILNQLKKYEQKSEKLPLRFTCQKAILTHL
jgi:hypothetical protein